MSHQLNNSQIAALQQMGITVWTSQADLLVSEQEHKSNAHEANKPVNSEEKQTHSQSAQRTKAASEGLQGLRAILSDKPNEAAQETQSQQPSTQSTAPEKNTVTQPMRRLVDEAQGNIFLTDIVNALEQMAFPTLDSMLFHESDSITIQNNTLCCPRQTTGDVKKSLWEAVCRL